MRNLLRVFIFPIMAACHVPASTDVPIDRKCEEIKTFGELQIPLDCGWKTIGPQNGNGSIHKLEHQGNSVILQRGEIWNKSSHYNADSSLTHTFSDRRITGTINSGNNVKFIHASRPLQNGSGDSLFIYMEDTATWHYYHFDGYFRNDVMLQEFVDSMRRSELKKD